MKKKSKAIYIVYLFFIILFSIGLYTHINDIDYSKHYYSDGYVQSRVGIIRQIVNETRDFNGKILMVVSLASIGVTYLFHRSD